MPQVETTPHKITHNGSKTGQKKVKLWNSLSTMAKQYLEVALFTATDIDRGEDRPAQDLGYSCLDCSMDAMNKAEKVCTKFVRDVSEFIAALPDPLKSEMETEWQAVQENNADDVGGDLYYTRNGHGVGFWEYDYTSEELGKILDNFAKRLPECYLYKANGVLHLSDE